MEQLTHSEYRYLMGIHLLNDKNLKASVLAKELEVSRNAVSLQLKTLKGKKLISVDENNKISLSRKGLKLAQKVSGKKETVKVFLNEVLGVSEDSSEQETYLTICGELVSCNGLSFGFSVSL